MIEFTKHAERKLKQRTLKKSWVVKTINRPDFTETGHTGRKVFYKKIGKLYLSVIFAREGDKTVVITAHWDKAFKPQGKEKEVN